MTKVEKAEEVLRKAKELGCVPSNEGVFVVFRPPLPIDLLMDAGELAEEIAVLVPYND